MIRATISSMKDWNFRQVREFNDADRMIEWMKQRDARWTINFKYDENSILLLMDGGKHE